MYLATLLLALAIPSVPEEPVEPPVVGQPDEFTGAVGVFEVKVSATPTRVAVGNPVLYTVRVVARDRFQAWPRRLRLQDDQLLAGLFFVEDADPAEKQVDARTREFYYRLKPRSTAVKDIPEPVFFFYDPAANGYQQAETRSIPLTVVPRPVDVVKVEGEKVPETVPGVVLDIAQGEEVLRHDRPWSPPGLGVLALMLLAPPLACVAWYVVWQRLHPDAARRARQRRSRAAQQALKTIRAAQGEEASERAGKLASAVAIYFRQRFDLPQVVPTPAEVAAHLARVGVSAPLRQKARHFFEACDALRFAPALDPQVSGLDETASNLVLAVEAETWSSHQP